MPFGSKPCLSRRLNAASGPLCGWNTAIRARRDAGARQAIVGCRGDDNYPIPKKLYRSVGFRELTRELRYVKDV